MFHRTQNPVLGPVRSFQPVTCECGAMLCEPWVPLPALIEAGQAEDAEACGLLADLCHSFDADPEQVEVTFCGSCVGFTLWLPNR